MNGAVSILQIKAGSAKGVGQFRRNWCLKCFASITFSAPFIMPLLLRIKALLLPMLNRYFTQREHSISNFVRSRMGLRKKANLDYKYQVEHSTRYGSTPTQVHALGRDLSCYGKDLEFIQQLEFEKC